MSSRFALPVRITVVGAVAALGWAPATAGAQAPGNPPPPVVQTGAAADVAGTTATLTGSVDTGGAETTVRFEFGTTAAYGLTTAPVVLGAGAAGPQPVGVPVTGLTTGTTYHVRVVATNAAGTTRGTDATFRTVSVARAPSVSTRTEIDLGQHGATLIARVEPRGAATTVWFDYGGGTAYGLRTASQTVPADAGVAYVRIPVVGLTANSTYSYRAVATNAVGTDTGSRHTIRTRRGISTVSMRLTDTTVGWADTTEITGKVNGLSVNGVGVKLWRQDHPFTAPFREVGTVTASDEGTYAFTSPQLFSAVRFRVTVDTSAGIASTTATTSGELRTKLRARKRSASSMEVRGLVYPLVEKGTIVVQRRTPKGRWITAKRTTLSPEREAKTPRSVFAVRVPRVKDRSALYRAVVTPSDAGAHVKTTTSSVRVARR